jgi:tetratricopeptide (TPR) repeat protein
MVLPMPIRPTRSPVPWLTAGLLTFTAAAAAQAPSPRELAERAHRIAQQHAAADESDDRAATKAAAQQLATLLDEAKAAKDWTAEHFVEASSPLLGAHPAEGLAISEAGLKLFPDSRFLWDHAGFAQTALADAMRPGKRRVDGFTAAVKSFEQSLQRQPDTWHAHLGLAQALDSLGDAEGALRELKVALGDEQGKQGIPHAGMRLAALSLRLGKWPEALAAIDQATDVEEALWPAILRVRVHALAKDLPRLQTAIAAMLLLDDSPRGQLEAADAWFYVGRKDDAQQALAKLPALGKAKTEEERIGQIYSASGAALAAWWQATDVSAKGPLRGVLTKALGHSFLVMDPSAKPPKPKENDLSASPRAMTHLLHGAMEHDDEQRKTWANRVLLALCLQAAKDYKAPEFEAKLLAGIDKDPATLDDVPGLQLDAACALGDPQQSCALTGWHAMSRVVPPRPPTKPAAPAKPPKPAGGK